SPHPSSTATVEHATEKFHRDILTPCCCDQATKPRRYRIGTAGWSPTVIPIFPSPLGPRIRHQDQLYPTIDRRQPFSCLDHLPTAIGGVLGPPVGGFSRP